MIAGNVVSFAGMSGVAIADNASTHVWLDDAGNIQTGTAGLPADRTTFLPLAEIVTSSSVIQTLTDLRGEAMQATPSLAALNISATANALNQTLDGIDANVTAAALNQLVDGSTSTADSLHRHLSIYQDMAGEAGFRLINDSADASANVALQLSLPQALPADVRLRVNRDNGFIEQCYGATSYNLVGSVHPQYTHGGDLSASRTGELIGAVPVAGIVSDVILSIGSNIDSTDSADGVAAVVKVNNVTLTSTDPAITAADGTGFVSTDQGDGAAAVVKSDGTEQVQRGDILTVDLTRTANGTINAEAHDVVVVVVIRADQPE